MNNKEILDSWKAISDYLGREIRTCYRWEKELGLPIYRIDSGSMRSKVFAYRSEIDEWLKERAESRKIRWKSLLQNKLTIVGLLSGLVLLSAIFAFLYFYHVKYSSNISENLSIAVLPFGNPNSANFDGYFPEGIANEIISNITRSSRIRVISQNPTADLNNLFTTAKQIGKELGVDYILKAKMKNDENKIRVFIQLMRTKDEKYVLNEEYEGKQEDLSSVSKNICKKINELLNIKPDQELSFSSDERKSDVYLEFENYLREKYDLPRFFDNNDPWNLYWQGKFYADKGTLESNNLAISLFRKAIEIDSSFALPYIGLAHCYGNNVNFGWDFNIKWLDQAEDLIKKAQTLSPDLPEYYATLIEIYLFRYAGFNEDTKKIIFDIIQEGNKKYPYYSQLNSLIGYYYFLKFGEEGNEADFDRALEYKEKSFWADTNRLNNFIFAELLMLKKEFYNAIEVCEIVKKYDFSSLAYPTIHATNGKNNIKNHK